MVTLSVARGGSVHSCRRRAVHRWASALGAPDPSILGDPAGGSVIGGINIEWRLQLRRGGRRAHRCVTSALGETR